MGSQGGITFKLYTCEMVIMEGQSDEECSILQFSILVVPYTDMVWKARREGRGVENLKILQTHYVIVPKISRSGNDRTS